MPSVDWSFEMKKPCDSCPFRSDIPLVGAPDWAHDVLTGIRRGNLAHSCHKTDPKADGFKGTKKTYHCMGFLGLMKNMDQTPGSDAVMAMVRGQLDWDAIPTDGVWKSMDEMMFAYLRKYRDEGLLSPEIAAMVDEKLKVQARQDNEVKKVQS